MDGWIHEQLDDGWVDELMFGWMMAIWMTMNRFMIEGMDELIDEWMSGWWIGILMYGWTSR